MTAGIPEICAHLQAQGWQIEQDHLMIKGFPVQFLPGAGLTEEAVRESRQVDYQGVPAKIFRAEHIIAIAASLGRLKDLARIEQMLQQAEVDRVVLEDILQRHELKLPKI